MFIDHLRLALQWLEDVDKGGMIEARNYTRNYIGFNRISEEHLSEIADILNTVCRVTKKNLSVLNSMGELVPIHRPWYGRKK